MKALFLVFLGGGVGSVLRLLLGKVMNAWLDERFPFSTLTANTVACFMLGVVAGFIDQRICVSPSIKTFWIIGVCGGFSTFSALSYETLGMLRSELTLSAILYVGISLMLGLSAILGGFWLGKML